MTPTFTLWDLIGDLVDAGASERDVVAVVIDLLDAHRIRVLSSASRGLAPAN